MQYDHAICSLFSYAFVFSDCNSTENVPKTIYSYVQIYNIYPI